MRTEVKAIVPPRAAGWIGGALALAGVLSSGGCTRESVRVAIDAQRRADQVQQTVFERQHEGLTLLLFRDLVARLRASGIDLTPEQLATLEAAWNERDLVEFWAIQQERTRALRLAGVDAKLFSDQAAIDVLLKALEAKVDRARQAIAAQQAAALQPVAGGAADAATESHAEAAIESKPEEPARP